MTATAITFTQAKARNPKMRRCRPVGIIHSGGERTIFQCCLCGSTHTCATSYRQARHVEEFRSYHDAEECQDERYVADAKRALGFSADTPSAVIQDWFDETIVG